MIPGRLYIRRVAFERFLGAAARVVVDFDHALTLLAGANASGKTTAAYAVLVALSLDDAAIDRYRHIDSEGWLGSPVIELWLANADDTREIHIRVRANGRDVRERVDRDWRKVQRPVEFIRDLRHRTANVELFREADLDTKVAMLLESLSFEGYSRAAAIEAAGLQAFNMPPIAPNLHPLDELAKIEEHVYNARTAVNSEKQRKGDLATELFKGLPAQPPQQVKDELAAAERRSNDLAADLVKREASIDTALNEKLHSASMRCEAAIATRRAEHDLKVAEMRAALDKRVAELLAEVHASDDGDRTACANEEDTARAAAEAARAELVAARAELADGREYVATLRERDATNAQDTDRRTRAQKAQDLADAEAQRSEALTASLAALKRYKVDLAGKLPIPGLEIHFDERARKSFTLEGIPLDQVNEARQAQLAVEVARLNAAAPDNGRPHVLFLVVDNAEKWDDGARTQLFRETAARGIQVIATAVSNDAALQVLHGEAALA